MSRRIVNITLDTMADLPISCRKCVFWELDPIAGKRVCERGEPQFEKEAWLSQTLLQWGNCGKIAYVSGIPAGYILYAPPHDVPRSLAFPTSPVSSDAVLLMTGAILPEFAGQGLGRSLVQSTANAVSKKGFKAVEVFAEANPQPDSCLLPADYLLALGFKTVQSHKNYPRLRLELRSSIAWKEDMEYALEKLLTTMTPSVAIPSPSRHTQSAHETQTQNTS